MLLVTQCLAQLVPGWVTQVKLLGAAIGCIQVYYIFLTGFLLDVDTMLSALSFYRCIWISVLTCLLAGHVACGIKLERVVMPVNI